MVESSISRRIADDLIDIGAVSFSPDNPYTWASGLRSPVYCDNRMTIGYPAVRRRIRDALAERLREEGLRPDLVAGTATAGIPHAAWLADLLELPLVYVRSKPKEHGRGARIEGPYDAATRAVVVEDLISTGGSSMAAVHTLQEAGLTVLAVLAIFSYGLSEAAEAFWEERIPVFTLTDFRQLLLAMQARGRLSKHETTSMAAWQNDPRKWSEEKNREGL